MCVLGTVLSTQQCLIKFLVLQASHLSLLSSSLSLGAHDMLHVEYERFFLALCGLRVSAHGMYGEVAGGSSVNSKHLFL